MARWNCLYGTHTHTETIHFTMLRYEIPLETTHTKTWYLYNMQGVRYFVWDDKFSDRHVNCQLNDKIEIMQYCLLIYEVRWVSCRLGSRYWAAVPHMYSTWSMPHFAYNVLLGLSRLLGVWLVLSVNNTLCQTKPNKNSQKNHTQC